ncbi:MAG: hypothetical protein A2788_01380 [Candidatus Abawacabacteria bacterium RIFCSPHIGHO2_01_FULL_46_8]|uniref:Uncharacterized protein n=1 Tax=Candidatus Abawacabacteria bacterium RIFCSPHIGHO2_01_FULL_46_8 TaxID=1817815 RepID=A0A1F4XMJ8_9BACT|nr:MAG: hypothetical protein A2788_01380 [Candidatus Abawacabacteria bacterium RIFCSPHIGHO2_01_FULL_46_8]
MSEFDLRLARLIFQSSLSPERKDHYIEQLSRGREFRRELALEVARENERLASKLAEYKEMGLYLRGKKYNLDLYLDDINKTELGPED